MSSQEATPVNESETKSSVNVSVMSGVVHQPPQWRTLPSGAEVTSFDVKVRNGDGRNEVIRVSWMDAPASAMDFVEGDEVIVSGRVRSYWSGRRSETDVLATGVLKAKSAAKVRKVMAESMATLQAACP